MCSIQRLNRESTESLPALNWKNRSASSIQRLRRESTEIKYTAPIYICAFAGSIQRLRRESTERRPPPRGRPRRRGRSIQWLRRESTEKNGTVRARDSRVRRSIQRLNRESAERGPIRMAMSASSQAGPGPPRWCRTTATPTRPQEPPPAPKRTSPSS